MSEPLRVLLVANTLPPRDLSGVGEQVVQLASGLEARGCRVRIQGRGRGTGLAGGVAQGARGSKLFFPLAIVPPFVRELRAFRPHVVQVHESDGALAALACRILAPVLAPSPRLVALLQVSYVRERRAVRALRDLSRTGGGRILGRPGAKERRFRWLKAPLQIALGRLTVALADTVLAPSRTTAGELAGDYGAADVGVVPNAMAREADGEIDSGAAGSTADGEDPDLVRLLFVGRLRIRKGVELLLAALAELRRKFPRVPVRLDVAGEGEHRAALEAFAGRLGLGEAVRFLGRRPRAEVRNRMGRARALCVPSTYEGMPLVVLEAMERELAVVAAAVSGIPEVVLDGETGWVVPPEDVAALTGALIEVALDPDEAERRGRWGRERLERKYRPERVADTWLALVGGGSAGAAGGRNGDPGGPPGMP